MLRVYACLTEQHDLRLVFVAGLICIAACLISMNLFVHANGAERGRPLSWLLGAATVFGAGVWAFHFIAALAYEPGFPVGYDATLTAISLVAAIGAVWLAMFVAYRFAAPVLGGAMIGAGIAAMHYIGMAALRAPAQLHWDAGYVLASIAIAMTCRRRGNACLVMGTGPCRAASWPRSCSSWRLSDFISRPWRPSLLCPIRLSRCPTMPSPQPSSPSLIATVTALIAALGLLDLIVDDHLALRAAREAERLRRSADHLARAQRIAHTGSIEQDLRTGAIEWFGETYRIFGLDPNLPRARGGSFPRSLPSRRSRRV